MSIVKTLVDRVELLLETLVDESLPDEALMVE